MTSPRWAMPSLDALAATETHQDQRGQADLMVEVFAAVKVRDVVQWAREKLGAFLQARRRAAFRNGPITAELPRSPSIRNNWTIPIFEPHTYCYGLFHYSSKAAEKRGLVWAAKNAWFRRGLGGC